MCADRRKARPQRELFFLSTHTDLHKAPLPGLQHCAGLLLTPADVVGLVVAPEVLIQLAGTHQQEGALQGFCPGLGVQEWESELASAVSVGLWGAFSRAA